MIRFSEKLKKILAILLCIVMLVGVLPMPAFAQEGEPSELTELGGEPIPVEVTEETSEEAEELSGEVGETEMLGDEEAEEAEEQPEPDMQLVPGDMVSLELTQEKDNWLFRLTVDQSGTYQMSLIGPVSVCILNWQDLSSSEYSAIQEEEGEWIPVDEVLTLAEGVYDITVTAAEELEDQPLAFTLTVKEYWEEAVEEPEQTLMMIRLAEAEAVASAAEESAEVLEFPDAPMEADYVFPQATVKLVDILDAVGLTVANNSTLSVDTEQITLSATVVKNKTLRSVTLTATGYFSYATLSISKGNKAQTITLAYPEPEAPIELVDYDEDNPLKPEAPADAIWANDVLYLTGKMPANAIVEAKPVTVEIDGEYVIAAYDINIYANANQQRKGKTWQPAGSKVQVHFFTEECEDALHIYHMTDDETFPELVDTVTEENGWVTFEAEHFSTYLFSFFEDNYDHAVDAVRDERYMGTVFENDQIILSGKLPRNAIIEAERADVEIGDENALIAYDIKIYQNAFFKRMELPWQPKVGDITVSLKSDALNVANVDVYHLETPEAQAQRVCESLKVEDGGVSFEAESFSVYAIIEHEAGMVVNPRVKFHFISPNAAETTTGGIAYYTAAGYEFFNKAMGKQTSQILKNGESLEKIADPVNVQINDGYFFGWYVVDPYVTSDANA